MVPFRGSRPISDFATQSNSTQANYKTPQNPAPVDRENRFSTPSTTTPTTAHTMTSPSSASTAPPQPGLHPRRPPPPHPSADPSAVQAFLKQYLTWAYAYDEQEATQQTAKFDGNGDMLYVLTEKRCVQLWQEAGIGLYSDLMNAPHLSVRKPVCWYERFR